MYFLNQLINYAEKFFFKNISIKLKHQKMTSHLYFTVSLEKFLFQLSVIGKIHNLSFKAVRRMDKVWQRYKEQKEKHATKPLRSCVVSQLQ